MKVQLLKNKNFSLLMFGKITSLIGSSMQSFALSLYVLAITGSATKFAGIVAITIIPQLILGPIAGVFVDRFYRKKMIVYLDLLSGIIVSIFAIIYFIEGSLKLEYIYILVIMLSVISTLFQPTLDTVIPTITNKEDLVDANSIDSLILSIGEVAAPSISGVVYGIFGLKFVFILNAITFFISAFSECFIHIPKTNVSNTKLNLNTFINDFREGVKFTISKKTIVFIVLISTVLNFVLGSIGIGVTFICKSILRVSDFQYGLAESIILTSMMFSSFCVGYLNRKAGYGKNIYRSLLSMGIFTLMLGGAVSTQVINLFSSNLVPYILLIIIVFVLCLLVSISNIFLASYRQSIIPLEYMGRVNTVSTTIAMISVPIGNMVYGILFDRINPGIIFALSSIIVIVPIVCYRKILLSVDDEENCDNVETEIL